MAEMADATEPAGLRPPHHIAPVSVAEKPSLDAAPAANARFTRRWYGRLITRASASAE
jgi:hypothetical protein